VTLPISTRTIAITTRLAEIWSDWKVSSRRS